MKIRLWRLGSLEHKIIPRPEAFHLLREFLDDARRSKSDGVHDVLWDAAIDVQTIDITPDGIDIPVGPDPFSPELRRKVEELIVEHLVPSHINLSAEQETFIRCICDLFVERLLGNMDRYGLSAGDVKSVEVFEDTSLHSKHFVGWYVIVNGNEDTGVGAAIDVSMQTSKMHLGYLPEKVIRKRLLDACNEAIFKRIDTPAEVPIDDGARDEVGSTRPSLNFSSKSRWDIVGRAMKIFEAGFAKEGEAHKCTCPAANFAANGVWCQCGGS